MMLRLIGGLALAAHLATAQCSDPKPKPGDYPAHAAAGKLSIGAELWGHGFSCTSASMSVEGYIAVEIAVYPQGPQPVPLSHGEFTLILNGRKTPLLPQSAGLVAASVKYDWERYPELTGRVGMGAADVILGRRNEERFPGDPRSRDRINLPRAPAPEIQGMPKDQPPAVDEIVSRAVLPAGEIRSPVAGFLFFAHKGKMKSVKSAVLRYDGAAGSASLTLR
jgi:hypothetical protein